MSDPAAEPCSGPEHHGRRVRSSLRILLVGSVLAVLGGLGPGGAVGVGG